MMYLVLPCTLELRLELDRQHIIEGGLVLLLVALNGRLPDIYSHHLGLLPYGGTHNGSRLRPALVNSGSTR